MRIARLATTLALAFLIFGAAGARAANLEPVGEFEYPISLASDPGNAERLFVAERKGRVVEVEGQQRTVFADISSLVGCGASCGGERGLLSIALAPDFDTSGRLFLAYAEDEEPGEIHLVELRREGQTALGATPRDVLAIPHPEESNHNGGQLQFGPEGDLFLSTGDGGGSNDEHHNAQDLSSLLGKLLRLDPEPSGLLPYTVPAGNPFAGAPAPYDLIWSYGLRNPFRFSFDRLTGDLLIADVGETEWEEVDLARAPGLGAGDDYGWNCREGFAAGPATDQGCATASPASFVPPIFAYPHADPGGGAAHGCAIIGGYVARGPGLEALAGRYLYSDHCSGEIRSFCPAEPAATDRFEGALVNSPTSFGEDASGRLYVLSAAGTVYRIAAPGSGSCAEPPVATHPLSASYIGIRTVSRHVVRHRRSAITAWVTPCAGRRGERVVLWRNSRKLGSRRLGLICSVRFRPRISRTWTFRTTIEADGTYAGATSRALRIKPDRHRRRHHRHHRRG